MKHISSIVLVVLILTLVGLIIWRHKKDEGSSLLVKTVQPFITNIENKRLIPGNLYPIKEIEVKSSISGTLEKVFVQIGSRVKIGDVIAQVKRVPNPSDIEIARRNLSAAKINLETDQKTYERNKKLFEAHVIPEAEFEGYQKTYELSREGYLSAQNQLTLLQEGFTQNQDLSNMVKATTDGNIIDLPLKEGASVIERNNFNDGTTIAVVARLDSFIFKGKVNETDLGYLQRGMKLNLHFNAYKTSTRSAILYKISAKGI
jgi:HlyD family secretion protein